MDTRTKNVSLEDLQKIVGEEHARERERGVRTTLHGGEVGTARLRTPRRTSPGVAEWTYRRA